LAWFFWSNTIHSVNLGDRNDKWDILVGSGTNQEINFCGTTNSIVAISKIPDPIIDTNLFSKILSLDNDTGQQIYVTDLIDANLNDPTYDNGKIVAVDRKHNKLYTIDSNSGSVIQSQAIETGNGVSVLIGLRNIKAEIKHTRSAE
jgi:hypothetical protein